MGSEWRVSPGRGVLMPSPRTGPCGGVPALGEPAWVWEGHNTEDRKTPSIWEDTPPAHEPQGGQPRFSFLCGVYLGF